MLFGLYSRAALLAAVTTPFLLSQARTRAEWGAPAVITSHANGQWTIAGRRNTVVLNDSDLAVTIQAGPTVWKMAPSSGDDMVVKSAGELFPLGLGTAGAIEISPYDTGYKSGVKVVLGQFRSNGLLHRGSPIDLTLYLTICLEGQDEELIMEASANEHEASVRQLDWPKELDARDVDHTVLSNAEGTLLPRNWPKRYDPINVGGNDESFVQSNLIECWSMSWWGFQKGKAAMILIVETPDDAAYKFHHPAGGPTVIGPRWRAQLGRLGYPRRVRLSFLSQGNYVDLAKRYRRYVIESGQFVSLKEKIARQPVVGQLIGTPHLRIHVQKNIREGADTYDTKNPASNYALTTFDERAGQLRQLKSQGIGRLCVTLAGWSYLGYDRQHPDPFPPAPKAGGWEGLKRFFDVSRELGYLATLHDQYRDYYNDAPSWDPAFAIHEEDNTSPQSSFPGSRFKHWKEGYIPFMDHWDGGTMSYLNPSFMLGHLVKNNQLLFDHGIRPQGMLLDVFGYVPPDEDFNPEHPATRTDCMRYRAALFNWGRSNLGFVFTEASSDWVVPYVDISSSRGAGGAIPVPLYDLVYHDAIMTQSGDDLFRGLLTGCAAVIAPPEEHKEKDMPLVQQMAALHARVGTLEMTKHEFLDAGYRTERTTFSDGTTVKVDWDAKTFQVSPRL
jgi:hypothetical protein